MKRFSFDIGTNSIGWAVMEPNEDDSKVKILDIGVRIFSDGREPGRAGQPGEPLNQTRRQKRAMRRILERRKRRKQAMYRFLSINGYVPLEAAAHAEWVKMDPYRLRAEALQRPLNSLEMGRILMQLSTRRGFKSNRKTDAKKEVSEFKEKINALGQILGEKTLGQYLWEKKQTIDAKFKDSHIEYPKTIKERLRFRPGTQHYPNRLMYEYEFKKIADFQKTYHPDLDFNKAYRIIFFQRPLRRPDRGSCTFFPDECRAYLSQPSAQLFKALQDINNLRYMTQKDHELTIDQKRIIFAALSTRGKLEFNKIRTLLDLPSDAIFNLEKGTKDRIEGFSTDIEFSKFIHNWPEFSLEERDSLVEIFIIEDNDDIIIEKFKQAGVSEEGIKNALKKIDLKVGVGSLSAKFMRECSSIMVNQWIRYDQATEAMGFKHSDPSAVQFQENLPYYGSVLSYTTVAPKRKSATEDITNLSDEEIYGKISNPTVHIALNQLRKLCNALIDRFGKPDEISVEIASELKLGKQRITRLIQEQRKNRNENERISNEISSIMGNEQNLKIAGMDIQKYRLWEELSENAAVRLCIYCGKPISAHQLFNGDAEIEHILPFSRTLKNARNNLTVAHKWCNALKANRTPFEAFGNNPQNYCWQEIEERVNDVYKHNFAKRAAFLNKDLETSLAQDSQFLESQITDTAFIAKAARDYLACIIPRNKIVVTPGRLTALLRAKWGLNSMLSASGNEKNRSDHRHHAIDAIVIGLSTRKTLQRFATANALGNAEKILPPPFPIDRNWIERRLKSMLVSYKPDHSTGGQLFDETAYGFNIKSLENGVIKEFFVRKTLASLTWNIIDNKDITNAMVQNEIDQYLNDRNLNSKNSDNRKLSQTLSEFSQQSGIQSVRIRAKNAEGYKLLFAGANGRQGHKAYQKSDIFCVDIWRLPKKVKGGYEFRGTFTSRADAQAQKGLILKNRPHSAAKWLMRLHKNDIIAMQFDDRNVFARIAGFSSTNNRLDIRPIYASQDISQWITSTNRGFLDPFWKPINATQNHVSIDSLFHTSLCKYIRHVNRGS